MMKKKRISPYEYWLDWKLGAKLTSALLSVNLLSVLVLMGTSYWINSRQVTENTGSQWLILGDQVLLRASEKITEERRVLETLAKTPSLITAVKEANLLRADWTAEEIIRHDREWTENVPVADKLVREVAESPTSTYLINFQKDNPIEVEVFVTDVKGLNVAMTDRTSDFRQSDEDWWHSAFADGKGATYLSPVGYDESAGMYVMDIGVPIQDADTNETIGVLRGSVDITVMIDTLKDIRLGKTGNVVLIDHTGLVLYSHDSQHFMKPVPDSILSLLQSKPRDWTQGTDMDGKPSILAYSSFDDESGMSLDWNILFTQTLAEANQAHLRNILISFLAAIFVVTVGIALNTIVIRHSMVAPMNRLTRLAQELSLGNLLQQNDASGLSLRKDEMGEISRAFDRLTTYFTAAAASATSIANKDLTVAVKSNSERDVLGIAFMKMVAELNHMIGQVSQNATSVSLAASQLATASDQSGQATNQIAATMQQVASGTTQQSEEVARTARSVEQMNRVIEQVTEGAHAQAQAAYQASSIALRISSTVEQVTGSAKAGAQGAGEAADAAVKGGQTIQSAVVGQFKLSTEQQQVHIDKPQPQRSLQSTLTFPVAVHGGNGHSAVKTL